MVRTAGMAAPIAADVHGHDGVEPLLVGLLLLLLRQGVQVLLSQELRLDHLLVLLANLSYLVHFLLVISFFMIYFIINPFL